MAASLPSRRSRLIRHVGVAILVVLATVLPALPASANQPNKGVVDRVIEDDLMGVCPFTFHISADFHDDYMDFFDVNGVWIHSSDHNEEQDTFTGPNGAVLEGMKYVTNLEYDIVDGSMTTGHVSAIQEKLRLPDGKLMIIAGFVDLGAHGMGWVLTIDKGNPGDLDAFCAALAQ